MAELKNFGAVFTFAIDLEKQMQSFYEDAGLNDEVSEAKKRIEKLERARREYVVEITLEPIDDLEEEAYALNSDAGRAEMERTVKQFYDDAAPKINVRQAQRVLERCGKQYA